MDSEGGAASSPARTAVVGRRVGAALLDIALMAILSVVLGLALGATESSNGDFSVVLKGSDALLYFTLVLLYYFSTEARWGQTLGKRLFGLRVSRSDGTRPGAGPIAIRTLLRAVDILPILYLLGFIVTLVTPRRQRLGDLAAKTVITATSPR